MEATLDLQESRWTPTRPALLPAASPPTSAPCTPESQVYTETETPPTTPPPWIPHKPGSGLAVTSALLSYGGRPRAEATECAQLFEHGETRESPLTPILETEELFATMTERYCGQWSVIYAASSRHDVASSPGQQRTRAVKRFRPYPQHLTVMRNEARILSHLMALDTATEHVIRFYGCSLAENQLVMDYVDWDLDKVVRQDRVLSSRGLTALACDLIRGLAFLHSHNVVHGDIKPANILLVRRHRCQETAVKSTSDKYGVGSEACGTACDDSWQPLYCDFGSARMRDERPTDSAATFDFMAPELFIVDDSSSGWPTQPSDVFALALTLLFSATGVYPYEAGNSTNLSVKIARAKAGEPLRWLSQDEVALCKLQRSCLLPVVEPALRPSWKQRTKATTWLSMVSSERSPETCSGS